MCEMFPPDMFLKNTYPKAGFQGGGNYTPPADKLFNIAP